MVYANINIFDHRDGQHCSVKVLAEDSKAVDEYVATISAFGDQIISIFKDEDMGSAVVLPEDFSY